MMRRPLLYLTAAILAACGDDANEGGITIDVASPGETAGADVGIDSSSADSSSADAAEEVAAPDDTATGDAALEDAASDTAADTALPAGPDVVIHIQATAAPVNHAEGDSGQTPSAHKNGIRRFSLMKGRNDPAPMLVFDHGDGFVEASYDDGADTVVGSAPVQSLTEGEYTFGRVVISHVRYSVKATMHYQGMSLPGEFHNVQVLSDKTTIDGQAHDHGWFRFVFALGTQEFPLEGSNPAFLPKSPTGAPIEVVLEEGETVLYFPLSISVSHAATDDVHMAIEFNVHESFRWQDQDEKDYKPGVFDSTPVVFEPVTRFGANSYTVSLD